MPTYDEKDFRCFIELVVQNVLSNILTGADKKRCFDVFMFEKGFLYKTYLKL